MKAIRLKTNPIIRPDMDEWMGDNINGPSLIRVPDWVPNALGKYYLYFAHHQGSYIRMAYADSIDGPWQIYSPGVMDLADSFFAVQIVAPDNDEIDIAHIASPDVHVIDDLHEIRMYYHGCCIPQPPYQVTRLATSTDGLQFVASPEILGASYWRAFEWHGYWYTLEMPGLFRRSSDGISNFEQGPNLFTENMRHAALLRRGDRLYVFYSNAHDCPEKILWTSIQLDPDWSQWTTGIPKTLLTVEADWEGADCPVEVSQRGSANQRVHQLRDPCIFEDEGSTYLLYSVAGERGIAIAELTIS